MLHHHPARVARQALGRFRGNARAVLQNRLARRLGIRKHRRVHVDHDLIALTRGARIDAVVERRFGQQRERVRLLLLKGRRLLLERRRFRRNVVHERLALLLVQRLAGSGQRLQQHRARFRRQPPAHDHHAVFVLIHAEGTTAVAQGGLARLGVPVHTAPAADDPLDVPGRARAAHGQ